MGGVFLVEIVAVELAPSSRCRGCGCSGFTKDSPRYCLFGLGVGFVPREFVCVWWWYPLGGEWAGGLRGAKGTGYGMEDRRKERRKGVGDRG